MSNTIEERAEAYKQKILDEASSEGVDILAPNAYYAGYKQGATEQRKIDFQAFSDSLIIRQGEYITLELIEDLIEDLKEKL